MQALRHLALVEVTGDIRACTTRAFETLVVMRVPLGADFEPMALDNLFLVECEIGQTGVHNLARSSLRPVWLEVEDRAEVDIPTHIELLGSPLLTRTERLRVFLRKQSLVFHTEPVKRVLLDSPYLSAIKHLTLQGLESFSKQDKLEIKNRFGAALRHP